MPGRNRVKFEVVIAMYRDHYLLNLQSYFCGSLIVVSFYLKTSSFNIFKNCVRQYKVVRVV